MFTIKAKLLFLLLPVTLLMLAALAYLHYQRTTEIVTRQAQESLQILVEAREVALVEYFKSAESIGSTIATTGTVQTFASVTNLKLGNANQESLERNRQRVGNLLRSFQESHWGRFHHIFLFDRSNRIVVSPAHGLKKFESSSALLNKDLSRNPWAMQSLHKGKKIVSDYRSWNEGDQSHPVLFFPVRDTGNRIQAVIGIELNTAHQEKILTRGLDPDRSERIFLGTDRGAPVTQQTAAHTGRLNGDNLVRAKMTGSWAGRRVTAQGPEVFGHYVKHDQYPWILGAEIETGEVFGDLFVLHMILLAGLAGVLLVLAGMSSIYARHLVKPIDAIVAELERIGRGDFAIEIPGAERRDEFGKLSGAVQQLVFTLQRAAKKLRQYKTFKKAS